MSLGILAAFQMLSSHLWLMAFPRVYYQYSKQTDPIKIQVRSRLFKPSHGLPQSKSKFIQRLTSSCWSGPGYLSSLLFSSDHLLPFSPSLKWLHVAMWWCQAQATSGPLHMLLSLLDWFFSRDRQGLPLHPFNSLLKSPLNREAPLTTQLKQHISPLTSHTLCPSTLPCFAP